MPPSNLNNTSPSSLHTSLSVSSGLDLVKVISSSSVPTIIHKETKINYHETNKSKSSNLDRKAKGHLIFEASRHPADREDFEATGNETYTPVSKGKKLSYM